MQEFILSFDAQNFDADVKKHDEVSTYINEKIKLLKTQEIVFNDEDLQNIFFGGFRNRAEFVEKQFPKLKPKIIREQALDAVENILDKLDYQNKRQNLHSYPVTIEQGRAFVSDERKEVIRAKHTLSIKTERGKEFYDRIERVTAEITEIIEAMNQKPYHWHHIFSHEDHAVIKPRENFAYDRLFSNENEPKN